MPITSSSNAVDHNIENSRKTYRKSIFDGYSKNVPKSKLAGINGHANEATEMKRLMWYYYPMMDGGKVTAIAYFSCERAIDLIWATWKCLAYKNKKTRWRRKGQTWPKVNQVNISRDIPWDVQIFVSVPRKKSSCYKSQRRSLPHTYILHSIT